MPFHWNEKYEIGIPDIDKQHRSLFDILNATHETYSIGERNTVVCENRKMEVYMDVLKLREYALTHFLSEERYMIKYKYPKFFEHKDEHDSFIQEIFKLEKRLFKENVMTPGEMIDFIQGWFKGHIMDKDKKFGNHVLNLARQSGVKSER
jgi:hemerythrin